MVLLERDVAFWFVSKQERNEKQNEDEDEGGGSAFLANVCECVPENIASHDIG
jgi:hypothetical protein